MADNDIKKAEGTQLSRRQFITGVGGVGVGALLGGVLTQGFLAPDKVFAVPASQGYLLVDTKKCAGCTTCMMVCSLTHHGQVSYALSRIQITQDSFRSFPDDLSMNQCRQCPYPACADACPTGANHVDSANGNVRTIDAAKCIGCERCINACPFTPSRVEWNGVEKTAQKCDLCADTPFWNTDGGPGGKQACVEACPMKALSFTSSVPVQSEKGYDVDLGHTSTAWSDFGFTGVRGKGR